MWSLRYKNTGALGKLAQILGFERTGTLQTAKSIQTGLRQIAAPPVGGSFENCASGSI
jgi:hypothetical protein